MNEENKLILSAYRSNGEDAVDPAFSEALAAAHEDAALGQWLSEQQAFDRAVSGKLAELPVPDGLRERIVAGVKVSRPRAWWRLPQLWMAAALVALLACLVPLIQSPVRYEIAEWQKHALSVLDELEKGKTGFDKPGRDPAQLAAWLHEQSAPTPTEMPATLSARATYGCKTWQWNGTRISLMCFNIGEKGGVHLFTTERAALAMAPPEGKPSFGRHGQWFVASWSKGPHSYMLAGEEGEPMLRELIAHRGGSQQVAFLLPFR